MNLTIDGHTFTLLPRAAAMVRLIVEHQSKIERHPGGCVLLDYAPSQVALSVRTKFGLVKIDRGEAREVK